MSLETFKFFSFLLPIMREIKFIRQRQTEKNINHNNFMNEHEFIICSKKAKIFDERSIKFMEQYILKLFNFMH